MNNLSNFYIGGAWVDPISDATMPVLNPATEAQIGSVAMGNVADVDRAVAAAKAAFESFSQTSKSDRLALLGKLKTVTEKRFVAEKMSVAEKKMVVTEVICTK